MDSVLEEGLVLLEIWFQLTLYILGVYSTSAIAGQGCWCHRERGV